MSRRVPGGPIQAAMPVLDPAAPVAKVGEAATAAHIPLIEELP